MLIKGGTIVDGSGQQRFQADLRIAQGIISEVGEALQPLANEDVFDASGCIVSPGFIEPHTHYDGALWWDGALDPLPGYGVTTAVFGNCGFSIAPVSREETLRREVVGIFSFFEDIPEEPFIKGIPWNWQSWPEYREAIDRGVKSSTHITAYIGHIAIRLVVMGMAAWERAATATEIEQMAAILDEALKAGAIGMSSNLMDHDGQDRAVPTLKADDAEWQALMAVIAKHRGKSLQVIVDTFRALEAPQQVAHLAKLAGDLPLRMQWAGLPTLQFQKDFGLSEPLWMLHEQFKQEGRDFWTGYAHVPITATMSLNQSLIFAQSNDFVWHEVVELDSVEEKLARLQDPDWRQRARHSWDNEVHSFSPMRSNPRGATLDNSANGTGPTNISLGEYQDQLGAEHPSDALAEWFIANGLDSTATIAPFEIDEETLFKLFRDPKALGNISDAGAHGQMMCGAGENIKLLTEFVTKRGVLSIEEAIHIQTGQQAAHFELLDRGTIGVGKRADITVFNMDEIQHHPMQKLYDVPDGKGGHTWRWTRDAAPVRLTLVDGVATFRDGSATDARPGKFISTVSA